MRGLRKKRYSEEAVEEVRRKLREEDEDGVAFAERGRAGCERDLGPADRRPGAIAVRRSRHRLEYNTILREDKASHSQCIS